MNLPEGVTIEQLAGLSRQIEDEARAEREEILRLTPFSLPLLALQDMIRQGDWERAQGIADKVAHECRVNWLRGMANYAGVVGVRYPSETTE